MKRKRNKKIGILVAILLLAVGFAAVTTTLYINGTAKIVPDAEDFKDNVVFDDTEGQFTTVKGTGSISADGKTITFESDELTNIGEEASMTFRIANKSSYNAQLGENAIVCQFVDTYASGQGESFVAATTPVNPDDHLEITAGNEINNALIPATNGYSDPATIKVKLIKSYIGDENDADKDYKTVKFQCTIEATAAEVE